MERTCFLPRWVPWYLFLSYTPLFIVPLAVVAVLVVDGIASPVPSTCHLGTASPYNSGAPGVGRRSSIYTHRLQLHSPDLDAVLAYTATQSCAHVVELPLLAGLFGPELTSSCKRRTPVGGYTVAGYGKHCHCG